MRDFICVKPIWIIPFILPVEPHSEAEMVHHSLPVGADALFLHFDMGGQNCAVVGCPTNRSGWPALGFFKIPKQDEWRAAMISVLRRADSSFKPENASICSRHFEENCFETIGNKRKLKLQSLPTKFLPQGTSTTVQRKPPMPRQLPCIPELFCHYNLEDTEVCARTLEGWETERHPSGLCLSSVRQDIKFKVNADLLVKVYIQGMLVPDSWCLKNIKLKTLAAEIMKSNICGGSSLPDVQELAPLPDVSGGKTYQRIVSCRFIDGMVEMTSVVRAKNCKVISNSNICSCCMQTENALKATQKLTPKDIHPKRPLSTVPVDTLRSIITSERRENKALRQEVEHMSDTISKEAQPVSSSIHNSLIEILSKEQGVLNSSPFMQLFWTEQKKALERDPKGMRWHPMMIRFAIYLHSKSPSAYCALREMNILKLPGETSLRDYTNVFPTTEGLQAHILTDMKERRGRVPAKEAFVALLHDEICIRQDLVYDQKTGDIVGFVNPDSWHFEKEYTDNIATHILTFMVVSLAGNAFKDAVASFSTRGATSAELYPIMWDVVFALEQYVGLKVIISTSDKASPNQRLYRLHGGGHKTKNWCSPNDRDLFFISDPPHLIKTVRNCLFHSKTGGTRYMWNNGKHLLWDHIIKVHRMELERELYMTKLRDDHVNLNSRNIMNVSLAAQVLSNSVATVMNNYFGDEMEETAKLANYMNQLFDITNSRFLNEGKTKRNDMLSPFTSPDDPRFEFLHEFLNYLDNWEVSVRTRPGNFTVGDRSKMMLSYQTLEGLRMTVKSLLEVIPYLLGLGIEFVLTSKMNQDPLEEYFGRQRMIGRRADNPNALQFRYQGNKLHLQRGLAHLMQPKGNTRGRGWERQEPIVTDIPLKRRK